MEKKQSIWHTQIAYLFIFLGLASFSFFFLYPILYSIRLSLTNTSRLNLITGAKFVGFLNFQKLLVAGDFYLPLLRTLLFVATSVSLKAFVGLAFAIFFGLELIRFKKIFWTLLLIPWALPWLLSTVVWKGMFSIDFGMINQILGSIGLPPINWLHDTWNAFIVYNVVETWLAYPFIMSVISAAMQSISPEHHEAAMMDGANYWSRIRHITLPLIKKPFGWAIVMTSLTSFMAFGVPYLLNMGGPGRSNEFLMVYGYVEAFQLGAYGYASAFMILVFILLIVLTVALVKGANLLEEE